MKTVEILYQAFRVRYSLNQLQALLDRGCRVALLGPDDAPEILRRYFGEPVPQLNGEDPTADLITLSWDLPESDLKELSASDACLILFPDGVPEAEALKELADKVPIHVKTLWMCLDDGAKTGTYHEKDLTLPTVQALPKAKAQEKFLKLLLVALPQIVVILARNWTNVRTVFCKTLTRRTAMRNGIRSGISSLPLRSVPVIGQWLAMFATSAEMMLLTASQLRLSFMIAAAHNRPLDFFDRISELWPIVGSAYGLRGASRALIKVMPSFAPGLKASIAFSGTYAIGEACRRYYEYGQPTSDEVRRELLRRSHEEGAREAQRLFRRVMAGQSLEDVEAQEEGAELEQVVETLTHLKEAEPPARPTTKFPELAEPDEFQLELEIEGGALEPTVELDAVTAPVEDEPSEVDVEAGWKIPESETTPVSERVEEPEQIKPADLTAEDPGSSESVAQATGESESNPTEASSPTSSPSREASKSKSNSKKTSNEKKKRRSSKKRKTDQD